MSWRIKQINAHNYPDGIVEIFSHEKFHELFSRCLSFNAKDRKFFLLFVHVKLLYFCASFNEIRAPTTVFSFPLTESAIEDETNEKIYFPVCFLCADGKKASEKFYERFMVRLK